MEKVGALINRLQQQYADKADESSLLNTALLLVTELQQNNQAENKAPAGKVSIIMPFKPFEVTVSETEENEQNQNATNRTKALLLSLRKTPIYNW